MSLVCMQTLNLEGNLEECAVLESIFKRFSFEKLADYFQTALVYLDFFGPCVSVTTGCFLLVSYLVHAGCPAAEKGAI